MKFLAQKTDGGGKKGKIALYCRVLQVSRQGFYRHLSRRERPWKYQGLAEAMREIHDEDVCNDTYGRVRMRQALLLKQPEGVAIPSERTVYRVMKEIGLVHHPKRKPNGITKLKAKDGKLYVSAIFDCFDLTVLSLATQFHTAQRGVFGGHELLVLHRFFDDGQQQGPLSVPARAAIRLHQPVVGPAVPLLRRQGRVGTASGDGAAGGNDLAGGAQDCDHAALDDHLKLSAKIQLQSSVMITQAASVYKDLLF